MMAEKKDDLYVGIRDPVEMRRTLLESSRGILRMLQRFERFKSLRKEKEELFERLKMLGKEIDELDSRLKAALPKRPFKPVKKAAVKEEAPKKAEKPKPKKPDTELDKIESSLSEIEEKLKRLS
jgi:uncharacterized coiled-coil DUF342 family protein